MKSSSQNKSEQNGGEHETCSSKLTTYISYSFFLSVHLD